MVGVVQLANTSDCGSEDRGFEPRPSPHKTGTANLYYQKTLILGIMYVNNLPVQKLNKEMNGMTYPIQIKNSRDAVRLSKEAAAADLGVTISCGTIILDPRSVLGLMALVGKQALLVAPDHSNPNEFRELIRKIS